MTDDVPAVDEIKSPDLARPPEPRREIYRFKKLPEPSIPADEFKAVLKNYKAWRTGKQELLGHTGADPDDEADAVAAALKMQAAERLVLAAEGLVLSYQSEASVSKPGAALGPAPAPFSLDDDEPVGFDLPFAVEA